MAPAIEPIQPTGEPMPSPRATKVTSCHELDTLHSLWVGQHDARAATLTAAFRSRDDAPLVRPVPDHVAELADLPPLDLLDRICRGCITTVWRVGDDAAGSHQVQNVSGVHQAASLQAPQMDES
jgi:hypothetical protein